MAAAITDSISELQRTGQAWKITNKSDESRPETFVEAATGRNLPAEDLMELLHELRLERKDNLKVREEILEARSKCSYLNYNNYTASCEIKRLQD